MFDDTQEASNSERHELQTRLSAWLDLPLTLLAFVMLALLLVELTTPLSPSWIGRINAAQMMIWAIFTTAFVAEFALARDKVRYLKDHWFTAISVVLPALRVVRVVRLLRAARALRSLSLLRMVTTLNRSTRAIDHILRRGQVGYVIAIAAVIVATGAAGVYSFEHGEAGSMIQTPADSAWWALTLLTTVSSPLEPVTFEGRIIGLLLRLFGLAVSGYLTALIAVALLGDKGPGRSAAEYTDELRQLREEIARLRLSMERERVSVHSRASEDMRERVDAA
jgi:voltage-gated potassium channel